MIMGMVAACPAPPSAETPPIGLMAMNCAMFPGASLVWVPALSPAMMVLGVVKTGILAPPPVPMMVLALLAATSCGEMMAPPPGLDGIYVMGRMAGHVWLAAPDALTSWILVNGDAAFSTVAVFPSGVATMVGVATLLLMTGLLTAVVPAEETVSKLRPAVGVGVGKLICITSGDWCMGDPAVWAGVTFSLLRHFARLFWNQT